MGMGETRRRKLRMLLRSISRRRLATGDELLRGRQPSKAVEAPAPVALCDACGGGEQSIDMPDGPAKYHLVRRTLGEFAPDHADAARQYCHVMRGARQNFDELAASADLCRVADLRPEDVLFMDTETCGLAGAPVFLVGVMFYEGDGLVFEQHLARNYAEEAAVLAAFCRRYASCGALASFNGKAFDMNMIRERCAFHGVELPEPGSPHLDLLHESRRRWRGMVPDCRLQTLERLVCGRRRTGDIPGWEIPDAYHDFVRTCDARRMRDILHHNLLDLLTLAELLCAILTGCDRVGE